MHYQFRNRHQIPYVNHYNDLELEMELGLAPESELGLELEMESGLETEFKFE